MSITYFVESGLVNPSTFGWFETTCGYTNVKYACTQHTCKVTMLSRHVEVTTTHHLFFLYISQVCVCIDFYPSSKAPSCPAAFNKPLALSNISSYSTLRSDRATTAPPAPILVSPCAKTAVRITMFKSNVSLIEK